MDYASLIAALPAETVTAVATLPQGIDATDHVYVSDQRRAATETEEAWWQLEETKILAEGLGASYISHTFNLRMSKDGGTRAQLQNWADQIRAHFHGEDLPASITGLVSAHVGEIDMDDGEGLQPDVELTMQVTFTGKKDHDQGTLGLLSDISGLVLHLNADDSSSITSDANGVSAWANQVSGQTVTSLTQGTDANKPNVSADAFNGRDAVLFVKANSERLETSDIPITSADFTLLFVFSTVGDPSNEKAVSITNSGSDTEGYYARVAVSADKLSWDGTTSGGAESQKIDTTTEVTDDAAQLYRVTESGTTRTIELNGAGGTTTTYTITFPSGIDKLSIGALFQLSANAFSNLYMCELALFTPALSAADLATAETILAGRWGITLS